MSPRVTASAGASVGNVGPGFDVLGLALSRPRDRVVAERTDSGRVELALVEGDGGCLPREASHNCAGRAAEHVLTTLGPPGAGLRIRLSKGLPLGSGLGSSGASAVAAAVAAAAALELDVEPVELLDACREGERLATGAPHPDNVAPSLLGGIVACLPRGGEAVEVISLPVPEGLAVVCVKPDLQVKTSEARAALPAAVPMADVIHNLASVAGLVAGLAAGDLALIGRSLDDRVAVPYRKGLVRGFDAAREAALAAGALGFGLSGSGPTVFALAEGAGRAERIGAAIAEAFATLDLSATVHAGLIDREGARLESG